MEEAMVPTLALTSYLTIATALLAVLPRLRSGRFLSEMLGVGLYVGPLMLAGYGSGVFGSVAVPITDAPPTGIVELPFGSSTATATLALAVIFGAVAWVWIKSIVDAQVYSLIRIAISGVDSESHPNRKKLGGFFASNLLQLALATGVAMFLGPVALNMIVHTLVEPDLPIGIGFLLPVVVGMALFSSVRVLSMFITAWMSWRPVFIAGAFGAAFASPIRDRRVFWKTFSLLAPITALSAMVIGLCMSAQYLPTVEMAVSPMLLQIFMVGTFVVCVQTITWFDIAIVACVGHQVGEFRIARNPEEAARMRAAALEVNLDRPEQQTIPAAPSGQYQPEARGMEEPITFEDVLGYRPEHGDRDRWTVQQQPIAEPSKTSASGTLEAPLPFDTATGAPTMEVAAEETPSVERPWIAPPIDSASEGLGFERLQSSLLPATLRSIRGEPERRFRGVRAVPARSSAPSTAASSDGESFEETAD